MAVASGWNFTLALTSGGRLYAFGRHKEGQCGVGPSAEDILLPRSVVFPDSETGNLHQLGQGSRGQVSPSYGSTSVLDGLQVAGSGMPTSPKLSKNNSLSFSFADTGSPAASSHHQCPIATMSCGYSHSVAVSDDGRVFTWGLGLYGQLGTDRMSEVRGLFSQTSSGGTTYQPQPNEICFDAYTLLDPSDQIEAAYCGSMFTMLVSRQSAILSFGRNDCGMLGNSPPRYASIK
jgi:alpha-tubulin suppressor-like RCC1 family protein